MKNPDISVIRPITLFTISVVVYIIVAVYAIKHLGIPVGDEPTYLLIAESIVSDGDIDLSNNYAQESYKHFFPYPLAHATAPRSVKGHDYACFPPGLPLIIVPAYSVGKILHYPRLVVSFFMCLVMALISVNIYLLAFESTGKAKVAFWTWAILSFLSLPILSHSFEIYPDVVSALIVIYVFRRLLRWELISSIGMLWTGLILSYSHWLHPKNLVITGILLLIAVSQMWFSDRKYKKLFYLTLPVVISLLIHCSLNLIWYGVFRPDGSLYGAKNLSIEVWRTSLWGLFLDRREGLWVNAPFYFLAGCGLLALLYRRNKQGLYTAMLMGASFVLVSLSVAWWKGGGGGFPNRHLLSVLPIGALPLSYFLANIKTLYLKIVLSVAVFLSLLGIVGFFRDPTNLFRRGYSIYDLSFILPDAKNFTSTSFTLLIGWLAFLLLVVLLVLIDLISSMDSSEGRLCKIRLPLFCLAAFAAGALILPMSKSRNEFICSSASIRYAPDIDGVVGRLIDDPNATRGKAFSCNKDESGFISTEVWEQIPSGMYRVEYRLLLPTTQSVASLDVIAYPSARRLHETTVSGPSNGYQTYSFDFQSYAEGLLSFRVFCHSGAEIRLDSVYVYPLSCSSLNTEK